MNKKETIQALEAKWDAKAVYLGAPSFAYEIKNEEEAYTVDRFGAIRTAQGQAVSLEAIMQATESEPIRAAVPAPFEVDGYSVEFPMEGHRYQLEKSGQHACQQREVAYCRVWLVAAAYGGSFCRRTQSDGAVL